MEDYRTPIIIGFEGIELDSALQKHLLFMNPAGVILFKRNIRSIPQVKKLITDLRSLLGEIIVAVDHEGGVVNRFPNDFPVPPSARALAWTRSEEVIAQGCLLQAQLVAHLGFNLNFTPVLDLAVEQGNQVIGTRAFSEDPDAVAEYARICQSAHEPFRIATTAKHFPGHGRTVHDSHFTAGVVYHQTEKELEEDLSPFKRAALMGIPSMMTAHLIYDSLDREYPASFSRKIIHELLREEWGYDGVIISDCVEMAGIGDYNTPERIVAGADQAGLDLLISSFSLRKSYQFQKALKAEIDRSLDRREGFVQAGKKRLSTFMERYCQSSVEAPSLPSLQESVRLHRRTMQKLRSNPLPANHKGFCLIELHSRGLEGINADIKGNVINEVICRSGLNIEMCELVSVAEENRFQEVIELANRSSLTLILLTSNAVQTRGYKAFVKHLEQAHSVLHIACVGVEDLQGICANEWATRGFNAGTGEMLAAELKAMETS